MHSPDVDYSSYRSSLLQHAQRSADLAAARPAARRVVGNANSDLTDLQQRRGHLSMAQQTLVAAIEQFHADRNRGLSNAGLGFCLPGVPLDALAPSEALALRRRASFLLNSDAITQMPTIFNEAMAETSALGISNASVGVSALVGSIKSQCERINADAVGSALRGERICPLTLQPIHLASLLNANAPLLAEITQACRRGGAACETAMKPLLTALARAYFAASHSYPGAPYKPPHAVKLTLGTGQNSHISENWRGNKIANLYIDTRNIDGSCTTRSGHIAMEMDPQKHFHATLLQGFETLPPEKKRAVLYIQMLLHEASEIQVIMGAASADKPDHPVQAQQPARRTIHEWQYTGVSGLGNSMVWRAPESTQRLDTIAPLRDLPLKDINFQKKYGRSMIMDPRLQAWLHSPQYPSDLRSLVEPGSRLTLQVAPAGGAALRSLPLFQS